MLRTKLILTILIVTAVISFTMAGIKTFRKYSLKTGEKPGSSQPAVQSFPKKKPLKLESKIRPLVRNDDSFFDNKPQSLNPAHWDFYNRKVIEKMKAQTSPELLEKLRQEFRERQNPDVENNMTRLNQEIEALQEKIASGAGGRESRERLQQLLDMQSKFKYLQEMFMNEVN